MDNKKNTILLTVIAVATLLVAVVGATFAYFTAQGGDAVSKQVNVITGTAGNSSFAIDGAINIYADATTFAQGKGNATGSSNGTVSFTAPGAAGGQTPDAADLQFCYSVSLNITANDFVYTVDESTPELKKEQLLSLLWISLLKKVKLKSLQLLVKLIMFTKLQLLLELQLQKLGKLQLH